MYAVSWKFRGLGLSAAPPGPSPMPLGPWHSSQRSWNTFSPTASETSPVLAVGVAAPVPAGASGLGAELVGDGLPVAVVSLLPPQLQAQTATNATTVDK